MRSERTTGKISGTSKELIPVCSKLSGIDNVELAVDCELLISCSERTHNDIELLAIDIGLEQTYFEKIGIDGHQACIYSRRIEMCRRKTVNRITQIGIDMAKIDIDMSKMETDVGVLCFIKEISGFEDDPPR